MTTKTRKKRKYKVYHTWQECLDDGFIWACVGRLTYSPGPVWTNDCRRIYKSEDWAVEHGVTKDHVLVYIDSAIAGTPVELDFRPHGSA